MPVKTHRQNAIDALDRLQELARSARIELEENRPYFYWEPKLLEIVTQIQILRLSAEMIFREAR